MLTAAPASTPSATPLTPAQVAEETAIAQSINAFGMELYASLQSQAGGSGNTVFSPISISAALAMAYAGANGQTATQMASVLHFAGDSDTVEQEFGTLLSDLNTAGQGGDYTLSVADALWGQQGMQILAPFLQTMQSDFNGALKQVDFVNDGGGALQTINGWVSQQTAGKIQNLISPDDINQLTRLILTNAVYFNGNWATAFDASATQPAPFTLDSGSQVQVSMMNNTSDFGYMDSDGFQVLDMPYAGGRLSMDVILPNQGYSAAGLNVGQLPANLTSWLGGLQSQQVDVSLPKFDMNTKFELGDQLQTLGMTDAFSNGADFSGITDPSMLQITGVVHQATIDVGETGTVAAGATAVIFGALCVTTNSYVPPPVVFDANHPFLFVIRDDQSGAVLFMGQEMDPTSASGDSSAPPVGTAPQPGAAPVKSTASTLSQRERLELALGAQETGSSPTSAPQQVTPPTSATGSGDPGGTTSPPTNGAPGTGSPTSTPATVRGHGSHQLAAIDAAALEFELTDLNALGKTTA
jgi:serpin B